MEQFTQWDVVLTLAVLIPIFIALIKPLLVLTKTLTRLTTIVGTLETHCKTLEDTNDCEHREFREKIEKHESTLIKHDTILQNFAEHT